jgi:DNA topoisomerase IA
MKLPKPLKAIDNPREIDYNLVNAQQARRFRPISGV